MKNLKKHLLNKKGFMSIYTIMWLAVLIPAFFFVCIDFSHFVTEHIHLKGVTDNASASAVTQINNEMVKFGTIEIDEYKAKEVVQKIITKSLNLNSDYSIKDKRNVLTSAPHIEVQVVNITSEIGVAYPTPAGTVRIKNPSVIVYAEYPVRGLFFNHTVRMKTIGVSQATFKMDTEVESNTEEELKTTDLSEE